MTGSMVTDERWRDRFTGAIFLRGDEGYEKARTGRIWHKRIPARYPAAVLIACSEKDLIEAVRLAKRRGWSIAVRAGGHSFPAWSLLDDTLLVDLGEFKEMAYDPDTGVVSATPSIQGGFELNPFLSKFGRFFAGGGCPSVGIGGFLLQGGIGWNFRGWGWACEQIVAIDVITAEGELVRADAHQNSDLFWAARGIGPGFCGLITRFHLRTRPIADGMAFAYQAYPAHAYKKVLKWFCENQEGFSDQVYFNALSVRSPVPIEGHDGGLVFILWGVAFCDTFEESQLALSAFDACPYLGEALLVTEPTSTTMPEQYELVDRMHPAGYHYRVDSAWVEGPDDDIIDAVEPLMTERLDGDIGYTFLIWTLPRSNEPDMAAKLRTGLIVGSYVIYDDAANDDVLARWLGMTMRNLEPYTSGQYWGDSDQLHREVKCVTDDVWERYEVICATRDPDGVFSRHLSGPSGYRNRNGWDR